MRRCEIRKRSLTRLLTWASVVGIALALLAGASTADAAQHTGATLSLSLTTPQSTIGPFVTSQAAATTVDSNNAVRVDQAGIAFAPIAVQDSRGFTFTVSLQPDSDLAGAIDPNTGATMLSGQFTMLWQQDNLGGSPCEVGPFSVNGSTAPFGSSAYTSRSGAVTLIDGAPSVPASQFCPSFALVNDAVPLPVQPAPTAPNTTPNPAWTLQVTLAPALALSPPSTTTTTTTTSPPSTTTATAPPSSPASAAGGTPAPPPPTTGAPRTHAATHHSVKAKTKAATPNPQASNAQDPAAIDPSLLTEPPSPDASTDTLGQLNAPNPNAIDPVPVNAKDPSSLAFIIGTFVLVIAAVAFALPLIGRDVRNLLPGRSRRRLRNRLVGPITLPPLAPDANGSRTQQS